MNTYLGRDSLEPFVSACRRHGGGLFCLVKTSNAGGADVQDLALSDGRPVWHHVAMMVAELGEELVGRCGLSSVGAVVGATFPRAVGEARRLLRYERSVAERAEAIIFVTDEEARLFAEAAPESARRVITIGNGVDTEFYSPAHEWESPYTAGEHAMVFTGERHFKH